MNRPHARQKRLLAARRLPHRGFACKAVLLGALGLLLAWIGCAVPKPRPSRAFRPEKLAQIDATILEAIAARQLPGAVLWLEHHGQVYRKAYGQRAVEPAPEPMTEDTIFDAASLTKVMATTPAILRLVERGQVDLDAPVTRYLPEFGRATRDARGTTDAMGPTTSDRLTVRHLLTHTSGLRPDVDTQPPWTGYDTGVRLACAERLRQSPGVALVYSDINFLLLGEIVRRVSGLPLERFARRELYEPLGMRDTGFLPRAAVRGRIAPTERIAGGGMLRGQVHDPTARFMGGVAGHAGLFTTAHDVARFARMLLNEGELDGRRIFRPETVRAMTRVQTPPVIAARRGLGWDIDSGFSRPRGRLFPFGSYGHTGFTGTSIWIDPGSRTFWILLSNRVHPDGSGNVLPLQAALGTLAAEALADVTFAPREPETGAENAASAAAKPGNEPATRSEGSLDHTPSSAPSDAPRIVLNGIDVLARDGFAPLKGKRVGLVTNQTGRDRAGRATVDLLRAAPGVELKVLFSPEHGLRGQADAAVGDTVDAGTGLPVHSLYGARRAPTPEQLAGLDALVFDIQDIGCRFYTYISTMGLCLEAAARAHVVFVVLDRVNPIGGVAVEGPVYRGPSTFTAFHALPVRHGMTVGELARMFDAELRLRAPLRVVPVEGWRRVDGFDQTGLPWTNPSPNMRSLTAATLYPGVGLLETAVSVGRGTPTPFEVVGAPYVNETELARALNAAGVAGVSFEPIRFTPDASVFKGKTCGGVRLLLRDRQALDAVRLGLALAHTLQRLYPGQFALENLNTLLQHPPTLDAIRAGQALDVILQAASADVPEFRRRRAAFLLYP